MNHWESNASVNGIEIYFDSKPSDNTLNKLKAKGFRWHRAKKCWYNRNTEENREFADIICGKKKPKPAKKTQKNNIVSRIEALEEEYNRNNEVRVEEDNLHEELETEEAKRQRQTEELEKIFLSNQMKFFQKIIDGEIHFEYKHEIRDPLLITKAIAKEYNIIIREQVRADDRTKAHHVISFDNGNSWKQLAEDTFEIQMDGLWSR